MKQNKCKECGQSLPDREKKLYQGDFTTFMDNTIKKYLGDTMKSIESLLKNMPKVKIRNPKAWMKQLWERIDEYEAKISKSKGKKATKSSKR